MLETNSFAPARASQKALYDVIFPSAIFSTDDIDPEYQRLKRLGIKFLGRPKKTRSSSFVFFDGACGNYIVLRQNDA